MTATTREFTNDTARMINDSFATAMKTGTKMFEESAQFWFDMAGQNMDTFRNRFEKVADDAIPFSKKNADRFHRLFDDQIQKTTETMRQGVEMLHAQTPAEAFDGLMGFCRRSLETMRHACETMVKANTEMFESWQTLTQPMNGGPKNTAAKQPAAK